ncbi:MAG: PQQ-binding-like beta-propeller repeat protein [Acidobacteria bacterium]|nr:PQQ-binding-like beta-propeller repeat protein [Acidobacteriota bacterium]
MKRRFLLLGWLGIACCCADNWPQWRGAGLDGVSKERNLPVKWSATENITWKLPMPAWTGATPIIWGERIFLNVAEGDNLLLWCVDRNDGKPLWKKHISGGNIKMRKQNMSSPSPVTDGKWVWVMTGTGYLKAFDFQGNEQWVRDIQKDYGKFGLNWGYGSSPLLYEDALFVQVLHGMNTDDPSYVLKIDKKTGKTLWRVERPTKAIQESPDSYTTPVLATTAAKTRELIISGGDAVTGHDLATGKELWRAEGFNLQNNGAYRVIASPLTYGDLVFTPTRIRPLQVYRAGGKGDVTESRRVWKFDNGPDVPTPVTDGNLFYSINDRGIVWALKMQTGEEVYGGKRIKPGTYSASPVLADGKIYITSEDGVTTVLKAGPDFEVLAENNIDEYVLSSVAVSDGQIFLRGDKHLYCIGKRVKQ